MRKSIFILLAVVIFTAALFAASVNMKEGKWQITMTMDLKGVPFQMPPIVQTQCITKKDLQDNKNTVPSAGKKEDCEIKDYKVKGNTVSWKTVCKDGSTGSGEITYSGAAYAGIMKMETVDKKGNKTLVNYKINGRRLGDCK